MTLIFNYNYIHILCFTLSIDLIVPYFVYLYIPVDFKAFLHGLLKGRWPEFQRISAYQ